MLDATAEFVIDNAGVPATHGQAQNQLLYAASVELARAGTLPWSVRVTRAGVSEQVSGALEVSAARVRLLTGQVS